MSERIFPKVVHRRAVTTVSRAGRELELMVLHSTEGTNVRGIADLVGLGAFFANLANEANSTVGIDDEGQSARYLADATKPWTQAFYNAPALSIEMVGKAAQREWKAAEVDEAARWLAYWSIKHRIPLQRAHVSADGRILRPGVATHAQLGALGGGHHDPGDGFPVNRCIRRARHFRRLQRAHFARQARR